MQCVYYLLLLLLLLLLGKITHDTLYVILEKDILVPPGLSPLEYDHPLHQQ